MECNKDEAVRAKVIAEKKMESKDFVGARKCAIKAQSLYPELENIAQMICVCDVHFSAENKTYGVDKDLYGILQVEQSADDLIIKKQYRKLALLLHPDKNKFPGAEAAFKFIGEAQRLLLDRGNRSLYDSRYRKINPNIARSKPPQPNKNANPMKQSWGPTNMNNGSTNGNWVPMPQAYTKVSNAGLDTVLTSCPFCHFQLRFYKTGSKFVNCSLCKKPFAADEMYPQRMPTANNSHPTATYTKVDISNPGVKISASNGSYQGNSFPKMPGFDPFAKSGQSEVVGGSKKMNGNTNASKGSSAGSNPPRKDLGKKGKKRVREEESSDSFESDSSTDYEDLEVEKKRDAADQRRSSRAKHHVIYNENGSDDDDADDEIFSVHTEDVGKDESNKANGNDSVVEDEISGEVDNDSESDSPTVLPVPDPDFTDFDQLRKQTPFKSGQLWAVYDSNDAMPRFYAEIKRVFAKGLKMRINWLEADPDEGSELMWVEKELPYSCGKFRYGNADTLEVPMFSHLMLEKLGQKDNIHIYPKKHQTWALFRDWSKEWISNPKSEIKYEYDFVEVISEYNESTGIRVMFLTKVKNWTCVFCRKGGDDEMQIQADELLRFSHRVPSSRIVGKESEGVPTGSFELDPASVPLSLLNK